ncbi:MAG: tetratricopeptide repeat protein [Cyanobacteria bacterium J06634_6]
MKSYRFGWTLAGCLVLSAARGSYAQSDPPAFEYEDTAFWANQCLQLHTAGDYETALTSCEKAISLEPGEPNADLWSMRGESLFELGRYPEALANYQYLVEQLPEHSLAIAYQCASYFHLNQIDEAIDTCELALTTDGDWGSQSPAFAWYYQGLAFQSSPRFLGGQGAELAAQAYQQAQAIAPGDALIQAELCLLSPEVGRDICSVESDLSSDSFTDPVGVTSVAVSDWAIEAGLTPSLENWVGKSLNTAVLAYAQVLRQDPENPLLWVRQGLALEQLGRYSEAHDAYANAITLNPDDTLALAHQCGMLNELQSYEAALAACEAAFQGQLNWDNIGPAYGWSQLSAAHTGLEDYSAAVAAGRQATALNPNYLGAWNNLAVGLWHEGKVWAAHQAIEAMPAATVHEPYVLSQRREAVMSFNKGLILHRLNEHKDAIDAYERTLTLLKRNTVLLTPAGRFVDNRFISDVHTNLAIAQLFHELPYSTIINTAETGVRFNNDSADAWYNLGFVHHRRWNDQQANGTALPAEALNALSAYRSALWNAPERSDILMAQGSLLRQADCLQASFQIVEAALNLDPNNLAIQQEYSQLAQALQDEISQQRESQLETEADESCQIPL